MADHALAQAVLDRVQEPHLLPFHRRFHPCRGTIAQHDRLRVDIVQLRRQVRLHGFLRKCRFHRMGHLLLDGVVRGVLHGLAQDALFDQPVLIVDHGVLLRPFSHQLLGHVLGAAGLLMAAHAEGHALHQDRARTAADAFGHLADGVYHIQDVVAGHHAAFHAVAERLVADIPALELLATGRTEAVAVVLHHDDHRKVPHGGGVHALVEVAFAGGAVAGEDKGAFFLLAKLVGQRDTVRHTELGT